MKTAEELFEKYSNCIDYLNNDGSKEENQNILFDLGFSFALAEHDKEIISLIDEMIKIEIEKSVAIGKPYPTMYDHRGEALTELKNRLEK